ncbi:MAG TPA: FAD-dependent monooxygenase [Streptosporangiaceae bacterium]|nr:FAD-dependent monooxygenase [Streptosporangiaceae bacterium]
MTPEPAVQSLSTQVLVVGAGPVGLLLACELRRARVPVIIVERLPSPMTESRASQLTTLTAELLHERGFDALLDAAVCEPRAHFGGLPFDVSGVPSQYAGHWKVPQYRTESIIGRRAETLGATLLRAHELTDMSERAEHVRCGVRGPDGDLRIQAQYVVGCDGAASTVRRLAGFTSTVTGPTRELLRADVTGINIRDRRFERLAGGLAVAGTSDGVTRVMVHAFGADVAERMAPPGFAAIARLWEEVTGEDISGGTAIWTDSFDNASGLADSYRRGRVLLAGDAAHWHMPIGGQALNVGLQDAVNLGWKLAGSVHGWAPPHLLDSYHDERHLVAARVLRYVAAQEAVLLGQAEIEPLRAVLTELVGLEPVRDHLSRVLSGLDVPYGPGQSPLAGRRIANMRLRSLPGSPATVGLLAATEPVVVRLVPRAETAGHQGSPPAEFPVPTVYAIPEEGFPSEVTAMLVRPDGYVAWAGDDEEELSLAIGQWFRVRSDNVAR